MEEVRATREASDFLAYRDSESRFADFHANRHTFITNLARVNVHPKLAQALARHSTINLTMNTYTHVGLDQRAEAVALLPAIRPTIKNGLTQPDRSTSNVATKAPVVPRMVPNGCRGMVGRCPPVAMKRP